MRKLIFLFVIVLMAGVAQAQTKDELEKQRKEIQAEIEDLKKSQSSLQKNKKESISQLRRVQALLKKRDAIIETINKQMNLIDADINNNNKEINRLTSNLDTLKAQYAKTIEHAYKSRSNYDMLSFIFSSVSFNDAVKRFAYLKAYREYRAQQVESILRTQQLLSQKNQSLSENKSLKSKTLEEQGKQMKKLEEEKKEKDAVVSNIKAKESEINKQLTNKSKLDSKIRSSIAAIIKREIMEAERAEKAKREAAAKAAAANKTSTASAAKTSTSTTASKSRTENKLESTPEVTAVSIGFENNRRKLPWPVTKGSVTGKFGKNKIEGTTIIEDNIGSYIQTDIGAPVKAIFEGTVSSIASFGEGSAVFVRHGKYITSYYNLTGISVNKGDEVKLGQVIGKAAEAEDEDGVGKILLCITVAVGNNPKFLNPEDWIKPR